MIAGVPYVVPIVLVLLVAGTYLLDRTRFGRHVYAVGGNREAARRAGIDVVRIRATVFVISSALAAIGAIIYSSKVGSVSPSAGGGNTLLFAVGAAVIGGTSLFGGRGRVSNAVIGGAVLATVNNGLGLLGQPASVVFLVNGLVLLLAAGRRRAVPAPIGRRRPVSRTWVGGAPARRGPAATAGARPDEARRHNRAALLRRLHVDGPCTRATLATELGLNRSTIKAVVDGLAEAGVVTEAVPAQRNGAGRPSLMVLPDPQAAVVLAGRRARRAGGDGDGRHRRADARAAQLEPAPPHPHCPGEVITHIAESARAAGRGAGADRAGRGGVGARRRAPRRRAGARGAQPRLARRRARHPAGVGAEDAGAGGQRRRAGRAGRARARARPRRRRPGLHLRGPRRRRRGDLRRAPAARHRAATSASSGTWWSGPAGAPATAASAAAGRPRWGSRRCAGRWACPRTRRAGCVVAELRSLATAPVAGPARRVRRVAGDRAGDAWST